MTDLLPCPFCDSSAESGNGFSPLELITWAWCSNNECLLHDNDIGFTPLSWNTRAQPRLFTGCLLDGVCRGVCKTTDCPNYNLVVAARLVVEPKEEDVLYPKEIKS